jgi:transposase
MNAYSLDLRLKVLEAVDRGIPRKEVVRTFGISMPTIERYLRRRRQGAALDPGTSTGRTPSICATSEERRALWRQLEENDEATLERHCELWEREQGVEGFRFPDESRGAQAGLDVQKKSLGASEGDEQKRGAWREYVSTLDPRMLVFVDECSTNIALTRL